MDFSFEPTNILKTVKRTLSVTIGGIAVAIALVAGPMDVDFSKMSMPDPLETKIACYVPTEKLPDFELTEMSAYGLRTEKLEKSMALHGRTDMNNDATAIWNDMLPKAADIPFDKVFSQYDKGSESFFFAFYFKSGQRLEATTYNDEDDDDVYFSVVENDKVFFQNVLPKDVFFENAKSTWGQFAENNA